jgi:hypothetical protein
MRKKQFNAFIQCFNIQVTFFVKIDSLPILLWQFDYFLDLKSRFRFKNNLWTVPERNQESSKFG